MNRHIQMLSLREIKKRGLYIILALIIVMVVVEPVRVSAVTPQLTISAISFRSNTETNSAGSVINDQRWLVYSFDFDDYYSGTFTTTIRINKASGYVVNYLVEGAQSSQTRQITSGNGLDTYADTFTFNIVDCKHFTVIYSMQYGVLSGLGYTIGSLDNLVGSSGGSGSGIVDYTQYLDGIETSLDDAIIYLDSLDATLEPLAITVSLIKNVIDNYTGDVLNNLDLILSKYKEANIPYYSRIALSFFLRNGFTFNNGTVVSNINGYELLKSGNFNQNYSFTLRGNVDYILIYGTNKNDGAVLTLNQYGSSNQISVRSSNTYSTYNYAIKTFQFNSGLSYNIWVYISSLTVDTNIYPIYLGPVKSMPEEVRIMAGMESNGTLLERIISLFERNNQQNDELNELVGQIQQQQQTVSGTIGGIETDINTNLNDVPLVETNTQLQNMSNVFAYNNNIFAQLWNALGKITVVLVLYMILMLVRLFVKRE